MRKVKDSLDKGIKEGKVTFDGKAFSGTADEFITKVEREATSSAVFVKDAKDIEAVLARVKEEAGGLSEDYDQLVVLMHGIYTWNEAAGKAEMTGTVLINESNADAPQADSLDKVRAMAKAVKVELLLVSCFANAEKREERAAVAKGFERVFIPDVAACKFSFTPIRFAVKNGVRVDELKKPEGG